MLFGLASGAFGWQGSIRYVDASLPVTGIHNGHSWSTAYRTLGPALMDAATDTRIGQVWVAKGTYHPDPTGLVDARSATFATPGRGFRLMGGFVNGMLDPALRYPGDFQRTILDGELGGGVSSYHVVAVGKSPPTGGGILPASYLFIDGFVIKNGRALGVGQTAPDHDSKVGGGIYCDEANLFMENCFVENNYALGKGGGVYFSGDAQQSPALLSILRCEFTGNLAGSAGGGLYMEHWASFEFLPSNVFSTLFHRNLAGLSHYDGICHAQGGGAIAIGNRTPTSTAAFQNNVFSSNFARGWGSAVWSLTAYPGEQTTAGHFSWANCTFAGNAILEAPLCDQVTGGIHTPYETGTMVMDGSGTMSNSIFWGNHGVIQTGLGIPNSRDGVKPDTLSDWQHLYCAIEVYTPGNLPRPFGNIRLDPQFRNPSALDFTLRASSPCLDTGSQDLVLLDYPDGNRTPTLEQVFYEFRLNLPRGVDVVAGQTCTPGPNVCGEVDMGAFELPAAP